MCGLGLILGEAQATGLQYLCFEMLGELPALLQMSALWYFWLAVYLAGGLLGFCPSKFTIQLKVRWDIPDIY